MFGLFSSGKNNPQREYDSLTDSLMKTATLFYKTLNLPDSNDDEYQVKQAHAKTYIDESYRIRAEQMYLINNGLKVPDAVDEVPDAIIQDMTTSLQQGETTDNKNTRREYLKLVVDARKADEAFYSAVEKRENPQVVQGLYVAFLLSLERLKFLLKHSPNQDPDVINKWREFNDDLTNISLDYVLKYGKELPVLQVPQLPELLSMYNIHRPSSRELPSKPSRQTSRRSSLIPQESVNDPRIEQLLSGLGTGKWDLSDYDATRDQAPRPPSRDQPIYNLKDLFRLPPRRESIDYDTQSIFPTDEYITVDMNADQLTPRQFTVDRPRRQSIRVSRRSSVTSAAASRRESIAEIKQEQVQIIEDQLIQASPRHSIVLVDETPAIAAQVVDDLVESNVLEPGDVKTVEMTKIAEEPAMVVQMTPNAAKKVHQTFCNRIRNWMLMLVLAYMLFTAIQSAGDKEERRLREPRRPVPPQPTPVWNPFDKLDMKTKQQDIGNSSFNVLVNSYEYPEKDENKTIADTMIRYRNLQLKGLMQPFLVTKFIHSHPNVCMLSENVIFEVQNDKFRVHNFDKSKIAESMRNCADKGAELIIAPMTLISSEAGHANYLIYNTKTSTLERFDPNGSVRYITDRKIDQFRIRSVRDFLSKFANSINLKFVDHEAIPIQSFESTIGHLTGRGLCLMWSDWYIRMLAINPHVSRDNLQKMLYAYLQNDPKVAVKHMYSTVKEIESLFSVDAIKDFEHLHWAVYGKTIDATSIRSESALSDKASLMTVARLSQISNSTFAGKLVTDVVSIDDVIENLMKNKDWWNRINEYTGRDYAKSYGDDAP